MSGPVSLLTTWGLPRLPRSRRRRNRVTRWELRPIMVTWTWNKETQGLLSVVKMNDNY